MDPRILFVVSGAYGDLAQVMDFSEGQAFRDRSAVALARRLYEVNRDSLTLRAYSYGSVGEIVSAAADWDARIVILMSAYGFPIEGLTTIEGLRGLVQELRDRGCQVMTTDPFWGFASAIRAIDMWRVFFVPSSPGWKHKLRFWKTKLMLMRHARKFAKAVNASARLLRDVTHLYHFPAETVPNRYRRPSISYFNPDIPNCEEQRGKSAPSWLFAISPTDYELQQRRWGPIGFVQQLAGLLAQTRDAGRRPILVAPPPLIRSLRSTLPAGLDAELNEFGAYADFERRLLDAEYAFYWNLFSASALHMRLLRRLPVFYFDRGHVTHFHKGIYESAIQSYYGGWEPKLLPQGVMEPSALAGFWADQETGRDKWMVYMKQSPTPAQVLDTLMSGSFESSPW